MVTLFSNYWKDTRLFKEEINLITTCQCEINNCYATAERMILLDLQDYQIELCLCKSCLRELEFENE